MRKFLIAMLSLLLVFGAASAEIANEPNLVINQTITLDGGEGAVYTVTEGAEKVVLDGASLRALAAGEVKVEAKVGDEISAKVFTIVPYTRICGVAEESGFAGPLSAWVDFNGATGEIVYVEIVGMGHPVVLEAYGDAFAALQSERAALCNRKADEVLADASLTGPLALAVKDACARFLNPSPIVIRPYQSMAVDRYLANNPYIEGLTADAVVATRIVAAYPEDCIELVAEDVIKNDKVAWPAGMFSASFKNGEESVKVTHQVFKAKAPGVAVVEYSWNGQTVLDAVEIYENFTLYPEVLTGSDAYGKVIRMPADLSADTLTYRVLGDKAMNFPGGTAGSTVIDVTISRESRTIVDVKDVFSSDSTYLSNPWEYGGGFAKVGADLFDISAFTNRFIGMSADKPIAEYELSNNKEGIVGGVVIPDGVDWVVTGATRTPNAIIVGVNAAIEQFIADTAK